MTTKIHLISALFILTSCSFIYSGNKERKLQTKIVSQITEKASKFGQCATNTKLFDELDKKRVRVVLFLDINSNGAVEKFKLDGNEYPEPFTNCVFQTIELISFPKFDSHEVLKVEQPFVFSKKD